MRIITILMWLCFMTVPTFAQEDQNNQEKGIVIEMDDLMFRYRIFDYKNESNEWKYKGDKPCIVDFYATWCAPCRMIAPIIEEIAHDFEGKIKVGKVNVDEQEELAIRYGISSIPTLLLFKNGEVAKKTLGYMPKDAVEKFINE